jgi:hypothetical protein
MLKAPKKSGDGNSSVLGFLGAAFTAVGGMFCTSKVSKYPGNDQSSTPSGASDQTFGIDDGHSKPVGIGEKSKLQHEIACVPTSTANLEATTKRARTIDADSDAGVGAAEVQTHGLQVRSNVQPAASRTVSLDHNESASARVAMPRSVSSTSPTRQPPTGPRRAVANSGKMKTAQGTKRGFSEEGGRASRPAKKRRRIVCRPCHISKHRDECDGGAPCGRCMSLGHSCYWL